MEASEKLRMDGAPFYKEYKSQNIEIAEMINRDKIKFQSESPDGLHHYTYIPEHVDYRLSGATTSALVLWSRGSAIKVGGGC